MRYVRLYAHFLRFSFVKAMEFRLDFFFRVGMDALWYAVQLLFFDILFLQTDTLMGWTPDQVRLFVASMFVSDAIHMTVFANNMWWFPIFVNRGDLDFYLVRPVSTLYFLSLRDFAANSFLNLLLAFGILIYMFAAHGGDISTGRLVLYALGLGLGVLLHYILKLLFMLPVFWMHRADGLRTIWFGMGPFFHRPDSIYQGWIRRVLTSVIPLLLIVSFPVRILFDDNPWAILGQMALTTCIAFAIMVAVWRIAVRSYSSASS